MIIMTVFLFRLICSGYMSPEYVMYGQFSVKSDVFSFGVLMLEIITGKKNQYSYVSDHYAGLLDYVSTMRSSNFIQVLVN